MKPMRDEQVFVDTNILVYAYDRDAGLKHLKAKETIRNLWARSIPPAISVQVLQEFYVNLTRKGVEESHATALVEAYLRWTVVDNDKEVLLEGIRLRRRYKVSLWDALILAAAMRAGAAVLLTEDLTLGQRYEKVRVVNPLLETSDRE
jgi:predicted nucleic acid-binding protein